ncbi:MAG: substrate-binding domain-containing protein [Candidatus Adiutrix sp.]|jgi:tungstate transport system substrate-binding protein|nr:substrate-binding domain-containing protein [Candidatus Adiutrix sp.]
MKKCLSVLLIALLSVWAMAPPLAGAEETIKMATTTSTQDSGLLEVLLPEFKKDTGIEVQVLAKGTGAAIRDGEDGNVDVIFVHDPAREEKFMADGFGTKRYKVMHNDFVILGDPSDPAGLKGGHDAAAALKAIADQKIDFISRGDESGTHFKELDLWKKSGVPMTKTSKKVVKAGKETEVTFEAPEGPWYLSIGQGMGKTLIMAAEKKAYTISDRGTYISQKFGLEKPTSLEIVVEGDESLFNPYGVIPVNPAKHPHVKVEPATKFAEWLVSARGQKVIADYKLKDQQVFYPDAITLN